MRKRSRNLSYVSGLPENLGRLILGNCSGFLGWTGNALPYSLISLPWSDARAKLSFHVEIIFFDCQKYVLRGVFSSRKLVVRQQFKIIALEIRSIVIESL